MEKTKKFLKSAGTELSIFIILIVLILASSFISPYFLTKANFANIGTSFSYIGTIAAGLTVVMLMGGIGFCVLKDVPTGLRGDDRLDHPVEGRRNCAA